MNPFWNNWYDQFKDRRYGALFLSAILAFFGLLALGFFVNAVLRAFELEEYFPDVLAGIGLLGLAWGFFKFRQAQMRGRERSRHPPLSRDEVRVARSKLMKDRA